MLGRIISTLLPLPVFIIPFISRPLEEGSPTRLVATPGGLLWRALQQLNIEAPSLAVSLAGALIWYVAASSLLNAIFGGFKKAVRIALLGMVLFCAAIIVTGVVMGTPTEDRDTGRLRERLADRQADQQQDADAGERRRLGR
ncbi:MAG: hypothetical protein ACF8R7_04240 [Phycisphaerales bacterium JB039]